MNKLYSVFILRFVELLIPILFISCRNDTAIEQALFLAGDNRIELEKAIIHYKTTLLGTKN